MLNPRRYQTFVDAVFSILADIGRPGPAEDTRILDFGCGTGEVVDILVQRGHRHALGFDVARERVETARDRFHHGDGQRFRVIERQPYRLPIEDASVDIVISGQVLEHVESLGDAFQEFRRIMRPEAIGIHIFPPKYRLLETHTQVPFGNILTSRLWHAGWIRLGFKRQFGRELSPFEHADAHLRFFENNTFYRTERDITETARSHGLSARFLNGLKYSARLRIPSMLRSSPPAQIAYSTFVSKVLVLAQAPREA